MGICLQNKQKTLFIIQKMALRIIPGRLQSHCFINWNSWTVKTFLNIQFLFIKNSDIHMHANLERGRYTTVQN